MADDDDPSGDQRADEVDRDDPAREAAPAPRKLRLLGAFARLTIVQIWIAVIAVIVGSGLTVVVGHLLAHPTAADQLQQFEQQQGAEGYTPVRQLVGDLRGDGTKSYIFVMRSNAVAQLAGTRGAHSDRVIILDDDDGTLHVVFSFQPTGFVLSSSEIKRDIEGLSPGLARQTAKGLAQPNPYLARIDGLMDVDGAGRLEVVGSWNDYAMQAVNPRPFDIAWDPARQRYVMSPLLTDGLAASRSIAKVRNPGLVGSIVRPRYLRPQTLHDVRTGAAFRSLIVEDYAPSSIAVISFWLPPMSSAGSTSRTSGRGRSSHIGSTRRRQIRSCSTAPCVISSWGHLAPPLSALPETHWRLGGRVQRRRAVERRRQIRLRSITGSVRVLPASGAARCAIASATKRTSATTHQLCLPGPGGAGRLERRVQSGRAMPWDQPST